MQDVKLVALPRENLFADGVDTVTIDPLPEKLGVSVNDGAPLTSGDAIVCCVNEHRR